MKIYDWVNMRPYLLTSEIIGFKGKKQVGITQGYFQLHT